VTLRVSGSNKIDLKTLKGIAAAAKALFFSIDGYTLNPPSVKDQKFIFFSAKNCCTKKVAQNSNMASKTYEI